MPTITLPHNGWRPRPYQRKVWRYWEQGGKHACLIWHRRSGKDDIVLHRTAIAAFERVATYWHLLPEAAHARKAIWDAVNPWTGKRRIDEAFPHELRATTREQEMLIKFKNGSTWQVGGSDRYNSLVGSSPGGVNFSEWALANPAAWAYIRPMLLENGGWANFITTPRGHNHAEGTYKTHRDEIPGAFAQILTVGDTGVFTPEQLQIEKANYIAEYGEDFGESMFNQEYYCSFDAAILGSYYGNWITKLKAEGRYRDVPIDPGLPVHTAWDLGYSDDTSIWFYQVPYGEVHFVGCYSASGFGIDHYIDYLERYYATCNGKPGTLYLPHDARAKTFASGGKSAEEQLAKAFGWSRIRIVPNLSVQDGIQAAREMLKRSYFDVECEDGLEALAQYQREWDDNRKCFRENPLHDWTSHIADAFRMAAVAYAEEAKTMPKPGPKFPQQQSINELIAASRRKRISEDA